MSLESLIERKTNTQQEGDHPKNGHSIVLRYVQDIITAKDVNKDKDNRQGRTEPLVGWHRPNQNSVKLNTDGCSKKKNNMQASAGGLIRDEGGRWLAGFMANLGQCDSLTAETWVVILAWDKGHRRITLETDSLLLHNMIKGKTHLKCLTPMLQPIAEILSRDWVVEVKHCYREANFCADSLANRGASMELGVLRLDSAPTDFDFIRLLQADLYMGPPCPAMASLVVWFCLGFGPTCTEKKKSKKEVQQI